MQFLAKLSHFLVYFSSCENGDEVCRHHDSGATKSPIDPLLLRLFAGAKEPLSRQALSSPA
jgi:hypothetical protein